MTLHQQWQTHQYTHHGIFYCPYRDKPSIGLIVTTCLQYDILIEGGAGTIENDVINQVIYITE